MDDTTQHAHKSAPFTPFAAKAPGNASVAGWTAGTTAFFAVIALINAPTWPVAFAVSMMMLTVATVCCFILRKG